MDQTRNVAGSRRRGRMNAAAAPLVISGMLLSGVAPAAAAAPEGCGRGATCLYSGYNYGFDWLQNGGRQNFIYCIDQLKDYRYDNVTSSVFNNGRSDTMYLFDKEFKRGRSIALPKGQGIGDLGTKNFNDVASSGYFESALLKVGTTTCK